MLTISAQQAAFYTKNGFLELEGVFTPSQCEALLTAIDQTMTRRLGQEVIHGRDLWRDTPLLKTTVTAKKLTGLAFDVSRRPTLRLACDQWFPSGFSLKTPERLEKLFSIQGLVCTLFIQLDPNPVELPSKQTPLGISPFPRGQGNVLLITPSLLLNWPPVPSIGLYCVSYSLPASVYVENPLDPAGLALRKLGFGYGDPLRNDTHPLINP